MVIGQHDPPHAESSADSGRQRHALGWDPLYKEPPGSYSLFRFLSDPGLHIIIIKSDQTDRKEGRKEYGGAEAPTSYAVLCYAMVKSTLWRKEWWHNIRLNLSYILRAELEISEVRRWSQFEGMLIPA